MSHPLQAFLIELPADASYAAAKALAREVAAIPGVIVEAVRQPD